MTCPVRSHLLRWRRCRVNGHFLSAGIYTAHKTFLHKDKILTRRLLKVNSLILLPNIQSAWNTGAPRVCLQGIQRRRPPEVQSAILRRHLLELTQSFIIPLVRWRQGRRGVTLPSGLTHSHLCWSLRSATW